MKNKKDIKQGYVKKETLMVVSIIALIIGFFSGVVVAIYKSEARLPAQTSTLPQPAKENQDIVTERAARIFELERRTSNMPDDLEAWIKLGNLYFDSENFEKAIWAYNKSLELKPDDADVLTDMGVMYRRSGRPREAIKAFDRAIRAEPRHEVSRFNKGIVLMHDLNDVEGALKIWGELAALNPAAKTPAGLSVNEMIQKFKNKENRRGVGG